MALAGKTTTELAFSAISIIDTGTYTIKVWSGEDSVISSPFRILVLPAKPAGITAMRVLHSVHPYPGQLRKGLRNIQSSGLKKMAHIHRSLR